MSKRLSTDAPKLSDTTIARIRTAAHRYVLAGGTMFPTVHDTDRDQHIANIGAALSKTDAEAQFSDALDVITDYDLHEKIYAAAWQLVSREMDAAFLFGAFVGLEHAALTFAGAALRTKHAK
jgi:hypothetical protein